LGTPFILRVNGVNQASCNFSLHPLASSSLKNRFTLGISLFSFSLPSKISIATFIVAVFSLSSFIFTHPRLGLGLWPQSELVITSLFASGALAGLVVALNYERYKRLWICFKHPAVLMPLLIAWFSILSSFKTAFAERSWFGAPELGEGAFWLFCEIFKKYS
jgi:hypothetical protein